METLHATLPADAAGAAARPSASAPARDDAARIRRIMMYSFPLCIRTAARRVEFRYPYRVSLPTTVKTALTLTRSAPVAICYMRQHEGRVRGMLVANCYNGRSPRYACHISTRTPGMTSIRRLAAAALAFAMPALAAAASLTVGLGT